MSMKPVAGRWPRPVVAAAVILDPLNPISGLNDSKKLSAKRRDALAVEIRAKALAWSVAEAGVESTGSIFCKPVCWRCEGLSKDSRSSRKPR